MIGESLTTQCQTTHPAIYMNVKLMIGKCFKLYQYAVLLALLDVKHVQILLWFLITFILFTYLLHDDCSNQFIKFHITL